MRSSHLSMLGTAGFGEIEFCDQSAEYAETIRAWLDGWCAREPEVRAVMGDEDFDRRLQNRKASLKAVEGGVLMRSLYVAHRPTRPAG